ncbi:hypothetical protein [Gulosibacter sp. 10]|uniref:hypothetical protein n=1 Tax=Gulosibacter sp. 10 TaxID=1255570 RepID=UPI00097F3282|nr:hypothetical protein [Gulosibacter sp. 10]SJM71556.1 hypothetical protein FM112_16485 [Gulosibacter sp. 10]
MAERDEGTWMEAIALFQSAREGEHEAAAQLLRTTSDPEAVALSLLRMLGVYLRGEEPEKLDRFIDASHRAGPPPAPGAGPRLPPLV